MNKDLEIINSLFTDEESVNSFLNLPEQELKQSYISNILAEMIKNLYDDPNYYGFEFNVTKTEVIVVTSTDNQNIIGYRNIFRRLIDRIRTHDQNKKTLALVDYKYKDNDSGSEGATA